MPERTPPTPNAPADRLVVRLWVQRGDETYLGVGRVRLLERIQELGSISAAARSMRMGYRHAWDLVEQMNRLAPAPLVDRVAGGRGGGGSRLTPAGVQVVAEFRRAEATVSTLVASLAPPGCAGEGTGDARAS